MTSGFPRAADAPLQCDLRLIALVIAALAALFTALPGSRVGAADGPLTITKAWLRPTPPGATVSALYAEIANSGSTDDRLIGASSPAAGTLEVHESRSEGGMMQMRKLPDGLTVPAHGAVTLAPGSYHIMLIGVTAPLVPGAAVPVTLHFQRAGELGLLARVADVGSAGGAMHGAPQGPMPGGMHGAMPGGGAGAMGAPAGGGTAMPHGTPSKAQQTK
ncbi:MAG: copper chaperone PCu(A)C [Candidatus Lambdaproteobacteria bacterium]|nr:copper chaperone PCu(A)C [Candidatus Lambdaproteobacteria bacterium]